MSKMCEIRERRCRLTHERVSTLKQLVELSPSKTKITCTPQAAQRLNKSMQGLEENTRFSSVKRACIETFQEAALHT